MKKFETLTKKELINIKGGAENKAPSKKVSVVLINKK
ncbi:MAG: bacteriocin [Bacteroidales bacterium]